MPAYTLLGATGSTGSAILRHLVSQPPQHLKLNILVRSKQKLLQTFPSLEESGKLAIRVFEGASTDRTVLEQCLEDADAVFMCVGDNESKFGMSLSHDTVKVIYEALKTLRKLHGDEYKPPTVVQLRSAALNPTLARQVPKVVHATVSFCLHYSHKDMKRACTVYQRAAEEGLLDYIFVDPPTIHDATGTECTGYKLISTEKQEMALSYADLGASMCELAERRLYFSNQAVGVTATGTVQKNWGIVGGYLAKGARSRLVSWMNDGGRNLSVQLSLFLYCGL